MLPTTATSSEVPIVFREPHVNTGFRRLNQPWTYYICSLFQIHNECMNIWTHLMAMLLVTLKFCWVYQQFDMFSDPYMRPLGALFLSIIALYFCSSCAHCFQNKSEIIHYTCFMIDYCGIGLYGFGSTLAHHYYCSEKSLYEQFKSINIAIGTILAVNVCLCCSLSKTIYFRPYPFKRRLWQVGSVLAIYTWLILPIAQRIINYLHTGYSYGGLPHHSEQIIWFMFAGFFFSSDIPQRFYPGGFDFIGHSHQLFHICIMMTTLKQLDGVVADINEAKLAVRSRHSPAFVTTYGVLALVALLNGFVMAFFRNCIQKRITRRCDVQQNGHAQQNGVKCE